MRQRVSGWELWPKRKSIDGETWLCRWCAKPLSGNRTSYCSSKCQHELYVRAELKALRDIIYNRDKGCCRECGVNLKDLEAAFEWYHNWWFKQADRWAHEMPMNFREAAGYASNGHLWEMNHKVAIIHGGNPIDPDNLETLCLKCHRKHTAEVVRELAAKRRLEKIRGHIHEGKTAAKP